MVRPDDDDAVDDRTTIYDPTTELGAPDERAHFLLVSGPAGEASIEIRSGTLSLGRSPQADLHLDHPSVSKNHCRVLRQGEQVLIADLGSTNGTKLEGERITRAALPDRCTLVMGQARILFEVVPQAEDSYRALAHHTPPRTEETS